jgi:hypothetical protein
MRPIPTPTARAVRPVRHQASWVRSTARFVWLSPSEATQIPLTRMPICTSLRANQEVVIGQIIARAVNILT